jgi:hypothetical protein
MLSPVFVDGGEMGRKLIADKPLTATERVRRHREKQQQDFFRWLRAVYEVAYADGKKRKPFPDDKVFTNYLHASLYFLEGKEK